MNIATADDTKIVDKNEKEYKGDLDKNDLIVFYGVSTKSIPAQTTPTKVVVLGRKRNCSKARLKLQKMLLQLLQLHLK